MKKTIRQKERKEKCDSDRRQASNFMIFNYVEIKLEIVYKNNHLIELITIEIKEKNI